jgi:NTE family protein
LLSIARTVVYRRLFGSNLAGISTHVYGGLSFEAGEAWIEGDSVTGNRAWSGSLFVGADTMIGPLYVGYGRGDGDRSRWYLNIGARF